jgi:hypothetical protein
VIWDLNHNDNCKLPVSVQCGMLKTLSARSFILLKASSESIRVI